MLSINIPEKDIRADRKKYYAKLMKKYLFKYI